jgi:hypothetical protein
MSAYLYQTETNDRKDSQFDVLGHLMPARMFIFVVVDEPGANGFLVRRCYTSIHDEYLEQLNLTPVQKNREVFPEEFGLWGKGPESSASIAEHVMGYEKITRFASTSSQFPDGATRMGGKIVYVDIAKAKRAGAKFVTTDEIRQALMQYATDNPHLKNRIAKITHYAESLDKEILVQPNPKIPPSAIFSKTGLAQAFGVVKYARVVEVFGIGFTAYDLGLAADQSFHAKSVQPIEKEAVRQMGGWGGAIVGARMGLAAGALIGLETGPGTVITGLIGGIVFGAIGYFGGRDVADHMPVN